MTMKNLGAVKVAVLLGLLLGTVSQASADLFAVDFTVDFTSGFGGGTPFGLSSNPILSGDVVIDSTKTDGTAFTALSWVTGSRTWALSDIDIAHSSVQFTGNVFNNFTVEFAGLANYIFTNNTAAINDGSSFIACNGCVSVTSVTDVGVPGPTAGVGLPGFLLALTGLFWWLWNRRFVIGLG